MTDKKRIDMLIEQMTMICSDSLYMNKRITDLEVTVKSLCKEVIKLKKCIAKDNPVMADEFIKELNKSLSYQRCGKSLLR